MGRDERDCETPPPPRPPPFMPNKVRGGIRPGGVQKIRYGRRSHPPGVHTRKYLYMVMYRYFRMPKGTPYNAHGTPNLRNTDGIEGKMPTNGGTEV